MSLPLPNPAVPLKVDGGTMQIFGVGEDGAVYTRWMTAFDENVDQNASSWSDWQNLGHVSPESSLFVGYTDDGRMQLFGIGLDGNVWTVWKTTASPSAPWSDWTNLAGSTEYGGISGCYLPDGRMQIFIYGSDGNLYSRWQTDPNSNLDWSDWESLGHPAEVFGSVIVGYLPDGRIQLFAVGADATLYSRWKTTTDPNASWHTWEGMGTLPGSGTDPTTPGSGSVAVAYLMDSRMQIFYVGNDNNLYSKWKLNTDPDAAWSGWAAMGGGAFSAVTVAQLSNSGPQIFAVDDVGNVHSIMKSGASPNSAWTDWQTIGSAPAGDPLVAVTVGYLPGSYLQLFAGGIISDTLYTNWMTYGPGGWNDAPWTNWQSLGPLPERACLSGIAIGYLPYNE